MSKNIFLTFKNEDWISTLLGLVFIVFILLFPTLIPSFPKTLNSGQDWQNLLTIFLFALILAGIGLAVLGEKISRFLIAFAGIFLIAIMAMFIANFSFIKMAGLESVFFSVILGLLIRNIFGLPKLFSVGVRSEYYIKIGLVLLGTSVLYSEILKAGFYGIIQAVIVVLTVWYFAFWIAKKMKLDEEMGIMLASAVSICGVSAAIATCGAIKGDNKKLSFVVSLVLVVAIPMMYVMPYLAQWMGLSQEVAGAWLGGTIDTTGAVVASGKMIGETAETYSVIIKSSQNVLLGIAAFLISMYWSFKGVNKQEKPTPQLIWDRFPKFVLGFIIASLIVSLCITPDHAKSIKTMAGGMREMMFALAFVCIGLETDVKFLFHAQNRKNIYVFLIAQGFNILITLGVALLLFGYLMMN
ncbi:MAG: YeiH family protein [Anaerovoracaceae bacterium]